MPQLGQGQWLVHTGLKKLMAVNIGPPPKNRTSGRTASPESPRSAGLDYKPAHFAVNKAWRSRLTLLLCSAWWPKALLTDAKTAVCVQYPARQPVLKSGTGCWPGITSKQSSTGALHGVEQLREFLDRHARRHRTDYVFARLQRFNVHPHVQRCGCEDRDGVEFRMLQHFSEVLVGVAAFVVLGKPLEPVWPNVANGCNLGLGMQMPLERGAEASSHYTDAGSRPEPAPLIYSPLRPRSRWSVRYAG